MIYAVEEIFCVIAIFRDIMFISIMDCASQEYKSCIFIGKANIISTIMSIIGNRDIFMLRLSHEKIDTAIHDCFNTLHSLSRCAENREALHEAGKLESRIFNSKHSENTCKFLFEYGLIVLIVI